MLRTFITDPDKVVEREPPVPTKIYVADPVLRTENCFGALTRPMPKRERELVDAEQNHIKQFREEKRRKRLEAKRRRARNGAAAAGLAGAQHTQYMRVRSATAEEATSSTLYENTKRHLGA